MELAALLEHSPLGEAMRRSPLLYPAANVGHIWAMLVFFAAVALMDLRLAGGLAALPWRRVLTVGRPVAVAALTVQAITGFLLLSADAVAIAGNPAFRLKLLVIGLGLANVAALELSVRRSQPATAGNETPVPAVARLCALVSLAAWLAAAALGRLIAYV